MTRTILYVATNTSSSELEEILPRSRFDVIAAQSIVAAHKQLQTSSIDCLIINNLNTIDVPLSEILSLLTKAYPHPIILIDGTHSAEIPISHPHCQVVNSEHLDALPSKIDGLIEQQSLDTAISEHNELQRTILDIIHEATKATNKTEINSVVFDKLQKTSLFEYVWLGSYDLNSNDLSIEFPSKGKFSIQTVTDILQISDDAIFDRAVHSHDIQSTTAPVNTRETAQLNGYTTSPSYHLNCAVVPVQETNQAFDMMILATYRASAFDAPEKQLLIKLRDTLQYLKSKIDQEQPESSQSTEEVDTFVATLVHELRSPLGIAQAYLDIGQNNGENTDEAFKKVDEALNDLEHTIDDLASMAKNRMTPEVEEIELEPLVREVWESFESVHASIQIEPAGCVTADPALLKILFRNVLSNAIEHGGENCKIQVGKLTNGFFIEDTGNGIPSEIQDEIFTRGFSDAGGLGVGLALVNDIVEAHEWKIDIDSEVGRGTRVEITNVTMKATNEEDCIGINFS